MFTSVHKGSLLAPVLQHGGSLFASSSGRLSLLTASLVLSNTAGWGPGAGILPRHRGSASCEGLQFVPCSATTPLPHGQPGRSLFQPWSPNCLQRSCSGSDVYCLGSRCLFDFCFPLPVLEIAPLPSPPDGTTELRRTGDMS